MTLSSSQKKIIKQASRAAVQREFVNLKTRWSNGHWLHIRNRYGIDCIDRLRTDTRSGGRIIQKYLREYIAASSVTHCIDGWSYLGRAIEAHLKGNNDISRHLGYYAELRAAMALLAAEGIGVFDNRHFIIKSASRQAIEIIPQGSSQRTHVFTWDALEYWATLPAASDLIFEIIRPGGLPLRDWLTHISVREGFRSIIAQQWLYHWGLDLRRFAEDRVARNLASYRPTAFTSPPAMDVYEAFRFVNGLWEICEPSGSLQFPYLDKYLLRQSLAMAFRSAYNRTPKQAPNKYKGRVKSMLQTLPLTDTSVKREQFLCDQKLPLLLQEAKGTATPNGSRHHIQVLARATLLLRIATGACHGLLHSIPNISGENLEFWWRRVGADRALWHTDEPPEVFVDLWTDIREALERTQNWLDASAANDRSYFNMWKDCAQAVGVLGSCERILLWGLGL